MARLTDDERIAQLEAQLKARKARVRKKNRARDTRLKVLLGTMLLYKMFDDLKDPKAALWAREFVLKYGPSFFHKSAGDQEIIDELLQSDAFVEAQKKAGKEKNDGQVNSGSS